MNTAKKEKDFELLDNLIRENLLSENEIPKIRKPLEETNQSLIHIIFKNNLEKKPQILEKLSSIYGFNYVNLHNIKPQKDIINEIPARYAYYYNILPFKKEGDTIHIAIQNPLDIKNTDEISMIIGKKIIFYAADPLTIKTELKKYYGIGAETIETIMLEEDKTKTDTDEKAHTHLITEESSMVKLVNQIIEEAIDSRATDIHIEPFENELKIRYRIDGVLQNASFPSNINELTETIVSRIKIMSKLNIAEKRKPQDGRMLFKYKDEEYDLRISILPTHYGEAVNIRILRGKAQFLSIDQLGLSKHNKEKILQAISKPHGVILVTGPTGSGKTTTLYAFLSYLNRDEKKIITIEDPVEYMINGIVQLQVNESIKFNFASGLRSMLRHDPDIMMVGEIRGAEEADITIRAALTGHLVFSTLHTNDAPSAVTRLTDIGIEPYLVSSSLICVIAQRLVRLNCKNCIADYNPPEEVIKRHKINIPENAQFKKGSGCKICGYTGYYGRTAIYEIMLIDENLQTLITQNVSSSAIKKTAMQNGMKTLFADGMEKVFQGLTTVEEVLRVTEDTL